MSAPDPADGLSDLLGYGDDDVDLLEVVSRAIADAQVDGRVEYRRRVGWQGRQTIAQTVLWRLREHLAARQRPTAPPEDRVTAAVERVRAYVDDRDAFYGDEWQEDQIDTSTGDGDAPPLLLSDLRAIAAAREDNGGAGDA